MIKIGKNEKSGEVPKSASPAPRALPHQDRQQEAKMEGGGWRAQP